ncbi:hypothetical protein J3A83DRAFT_4191206 [Scleroderma citrinum]
MANTGPPSGWYRITTSAQDHIVILGGQPCYLQQQRPNGTYAIWPESGGSVQAQDGNLAIEQGVKPHLWIIAQDDIQANTYTICKAGGPNHRVYLTTTESDNPNQRFRFLPANCMHGNIHMNR